MEFAKHPSVEMVDLFSKKPFQGQEPEKARVIFLNSDANYSPEISNHPFFDYILEYQNDGITFWHKYGCHHPFLLPNYPFSKNQGGVPFHRNFRKIGLTKDYAEYVCFLELLDIPTVGMKSKDKKEFFGLLSLPHLKRIDDLISRDGNRLFLIPGGILQDMKKISTMFPVFKWLDYPPRDSQKYFKVINGNKIKQIYHFSASQIHSQLPEIALEIDNWLKKNIDNQNNTCPESNNLAHVPLPRSNNLRRNGSTRPGNNNPAAPVPAKVADSEKGEYQVLLIVFKMFWEALLLGFRFSFACARTFILFILICLKRMK